MADETIDNLTPDYVMGNERQYKQLNFDFALPVALLITQELVIADFTNREATAIAASAVTIVKLDADGAHTAIAAGDDLNGYKIAYKSAGGDAITTAIAETLAYWSVT